MKTLCLMCFVMLAAHQGVAQKASRLFYFISKDSLLGVKNGKGRVIIRPAYNVRLNGVDANETINSELITFYVSKFETRKIAPSWGDAYNREGKLLYHPMSFDNGPDYFVEERARCVENNKVGFVNRNGAIVVKPQWDWVSEYNYGYAFACNGCYLDTTIKGEEHAIIAYPAGVDTCWINTRGERIAPLHTRQQEKDLEINGKFLPYPFNYTTKEQQLIDSFNQTAIISQIHFSNYYSIIEGKEKNLQFEIVDKPSATSDYYIVQAYQRSNGYYFPVDMLFAVSVQGEWFFAFEERTRFRDWVQKQLKSCEAFFSTHPDAPYKFDIKKVKY